MFRFLPNPKAKLLDQVREILRLRHYSIRTEQSYCDWIRRYIKFHRMTSRAELAPGVPKVEMIWRSMDEWRLRPRIRQWAG